MNIYRSFVNVHTVMSKLAVPARNSNPKNLIRGGSIFQKSLWLVQAEGPIMFHLGIYIDFSHPENVRWIGIPLANASKD